MTIAIPTGVAVTGGDWLIIQAYDALGDMERVELIEIVVQLAGEAEPNLISCSSDLIDLLAQRHGLPNLGDAGQYKIDYDRREFVVDKNAWEMWINER